MTRSFRDPTMKITKLMYIFLLILFVSSSSSSSSASITSVEAASFNFTEFSTTLSDSVIEQVAFTAEGRVAYALTAFGNVYVSYDGSYSWSRLYFEGQGDDSIYSILQTANDGVFFFGVGRHHYRTVDQGATIQTVLYGYIVESISFHPNNSDWILFTVGQDICQISPTSSSCYYTLYTSDDGGVRVFTQFLPYVIPSEVSFGNAGTYAVSPYVFYVVAAASASVANSIYNYHLYQYQDFRSLLVWQEGDSETMGSYVKQSPRLLVQSCVQLYISNEFILALSLSRSGASGQLAALYVSAYGGPMLASRFPQTIDSAATYYIQDMDNGAIWMGLYEKRDDPSDEGNLYLSNGLGQDYRLTLPYITRDTIKKTTSLALAYHNVEGIVGIVFSSRSLVPGGLAQDSVHQTQGTFNQGGSWAPLVQVYDTDHHQMTCPPAPPRPDNSTLHEDIVCSLNIDFFKHPPISSDRAIGTIFAVGTVSRGVAIGPSSTADTFMSLDAGLTWTKIHEGVKMMQVGYHGSIVIALDADEPVHSLKYSLTPQVPYSWVELNFTTPTISTQTVNTPYIMPVLNETTGLWTNQTFINTTTITNVDYHDMLVDEIRVVPSLNDRWFILEGSRDDGDTTTFIHVDFSFLNIPICQGAEDPSNPSSDYEMYTPLESSGRCLLGQRVSFLRKRPSSSCFDPLPSHNTTFVNICACERADYECDYGYIIKSNTNDTCVRDESVSLAPFACRPGVSYQQTRGYRKIGGDQCQGDINLDSYTMVCPIPPPPPEPGIVEKVIHVVQTNPGTIAGAVIGSIAGVIVLVLIGYFGRQWYVSRAYNYQRKANFDEAPSGNMASSSSAAADLESARSENNAL
eukprot:TRINITY_DN416_c2_g1_i6.p1 TRINITY_DN416_c2_g1~~TRINITY_DN416_c2_g1_i6.p1  ORF type:complete len:904 (+),score=175.92 TRINITY_DN416_c2_g1_i6:144-2714(+)